MGVRGPIGDIQPFVELAQRPDTTVYKAYQRSLERFVLLKVMRPGVNVPSDEVERFGREARLVARIQHPNVVAVYDYGVEDGETYIASEYVEGSDLGVILEAGRMPVDIVLYVLRMITEGLAAAHERGVLHRDVKPANILVSASGDVKIADFGMASLQNEADEVRGTLAYLSPEQLKGRPADERSDLFSLGATLFEMLAGRRAFQGSGRSSTIDAILHFDPMPLLDADRRISPSLRDLCSALLDKQPEGRPQTASGVLAEISKVTRMTPAASREELAVYLRDPDSYRAEEEFAGPSEALPERPARQSPRRGVVLMFSAAVAVFALAALMVRMLADEPATVVEPPIQLEPVPDLAISESEEEDPPESDPTRPSAEPAVQPDAPASDERVAEADPLAVEPEQAILPFLPPVEIAEPGPATATLQIVSDPWVAVFVNGDSVGTTPMPALTLSPGPHEILLRNPYFPAFRRSLRLDSGTTDTLSVSLWTTVAQVSLHVRPWAVVYVNGEMAGTVPLRDRPFYLAPGTHVLRLENDALGVSREVTVNVKEGEARVLEFDLETGLR